RRRTQRRRQADRRRPEPLPDSPDPAAARGAGAFPVGVAMSVRRNGTVMEPAAPFKRTRGVERLLDRNTPTDDAADVPSVLECFGNPLEPDAPTRRAGNVTWRGARLADLLDRAGLHAGARLVWAEGLDQGTFAGIHSEHY